MLNPDQRPHNQQADDHLCSIYAISSLRPKRQVRPVSAAAKHFARLP